MINTDNGKNSVNAWTIDLNLFKYEFLNHKELNLQVKDRLKVIDLLHHDKREGFSVMYF